jgi:hypothetical protein
VEILDIQSDGMKGEIEAGTSLKFHRLKELLICHSDYSEFLADIFKSTPVLSSLRLTWSGLETISGKHSLRKLVLQGIGCKYQFFEATATVLARKLTILCASKIN